MWLVLLLDFSLCSATASASASSMTLILTFGLGKKLTFKLESELKSYKPFPFRTGNATTGRLFPSSTMINPDKWWLAGGGDTTSETFTYENGFENFVELPVSLTNHNLVNVDGKNFVLSGNYFATYSSYLYNTEVGSWSPLSNLTYPRSRSQASLFLQK